MANDGLDHFPLMVDKIRVRSKDKSFVVQSNDKAFSHSLIIHEPNLQSDCWVWAMCIKSDTQ